MEASALARPIIGANVGGIPELIVAGETGFVFRSGDVDSLVAVLLQVQNLSQESLRRVGAAGRELMRTEFSPSLYRDRMLGLYEEVGVIH